jgi:hypothetical protein
MIEVGGIYKLLHSIKGWPVENAHSLEDAAQVILGSPYWEIPKDCYRVMDKNETYCLLAVSRSGKVSPNNRYLAVNISLGDYFRAAGEDCRLDDEDLLETGLE